MNNWNEDARCMQAENLWPAETLSTNQDKNVYAKKEQERKRDTEKEKKYAKRTKELVNDCCKWREKTEIN